MTILNLKTRRLRILVVIASYGENNLVFLKDIINRYQSMPMEVDLMVVTEALKSIDLGVKMIVGLPIKNTHSLPFAHKKIFAENIDRYDLFIYSEDDIKVSKENIEAFVSVTSQLKPNEIAGYIRFEVGKNNNVFLPDVHGGFHWKPNSVKFRGDYTVAEFTNEHAGFYILTQAQLIRAITSNGFIRPPYEGRYSMLETAATDPYSCCGFRKVICISALDQFLIHHMSNRYAGSVGLPLDTFKSQIKTLVNIYMGNHPNITLCEVEPKVFHRKFYKSYYEKTSREVMNMIPRNAKNILSVGCGWGDTESELEKLGSKVTAIPLDSIIGSIAESRGIEVIYQTLEEGLNTLRGRKFDGIIMTNLLHLLPDVRKVIKSLSLLNKTGGSLILSGYNFSFLPYIIKWVFGFEDYRKVRDFKQSGVNCYGINTIKKIIEENGYKITSLQWINFAQPRRFLMLNHWPGRLVARNWVVKALQI